MPKHCRKHVCCHPLATSPYHYIRRDWSSVKMAGDLNMSNEPKQLIVHKNRLCDELVAALQGCSNTHLAQVATDIIERIGHQRAIVEHIGDDEFKITTI